MKTLKRILILALSLCFANIAMAAFTSDMKSTQTASITTADATDVKTMTVALKKIADNATATEIGWTGVTAATTKWKASDHYLEVTYSSNQPGWGVQIGTDNKSTSANPKYTGANDTANGLIELSTGKTKLPTCWRVVDDKITGDELNIAEYKGTDGYNHLAQDLNGNGVADDKDPSTPNDIQGYNCWVYMEDKAQDGKSGILGVGVWVNGDGSVTIVDAGGIHHTDAGYGDGWGSSPIYVYPGANFINSTEKTTYKTNTLFLELYHM